MLGSVIRLPSTRREEEQIRARAQTALEFFGKRLAGYRQDQPAFALSYANRRRLEMAARWRRIPCSSCSTSRPPG